MFATLKYHPQTSLSEVGNKASSRSPGSISRLACIHCREKKLRCKFGERGCERCLLKELECTYPQRASRARPKKNATFSNESAVGDNDGSRSPELVTNTPETWDSRNQPFDEGHDQDMLNAVPSRSDSAQPAVAMYADSQPFGKAVPADVGIGRGVQLSTANSTTANALASKAGEEAPTDANHAFMDLSASEYDFSPTDMDAHGLDSGLLSPLDSTVWCNDWLNPAWLQDATAAVPPPQPQSGTEPPSVGVARKTTDQAQPQPPSPPTPTPMPTPMTSSSSSPLASPSSRCNCVQLAIEALERAAAWAEMDDFRRAPSALAAHKESLTQCEAWLACTRCSSPSSVITLILVITDKLIASFRHIHAFSQSSAVAAAPTAMTTMTTSLDLATAAAAAAAASAAAATGPSLARSGGGGEVVAQQLDRSISLGDYQIESSGEWSLVMNVLLSSQLSRLGRLFAKLWTRLNSSNEELQVQIIQQQQDRLQTFMTHFKRSTPCSAC